MLITRRLIDFAVRRKMNIKNENMSFYREHISLFRKIEF